jgi:hypothetical protein
MRVRKLRVEDDLVDRLREIVTHDSDVDHVSKPLGENRLVRLSPWHALHGEAAQRRLQRTRLTHHLQAEAAVEVAPRVGLIELVAEDGGADWTGSAVERLGKDAADRGERMEHQVLADQPAAVRQTVWIPW